MVFQGQYFINILESSQVSESLESMVVLFVVQIQD